MHTSSFSIYDMTTPLDKIIVFRPQYKSVIWGGSRIAALKGEAIDGTDIGESWEISAITGHESVVSQGKHKGMTITELANIYGADLLGKSVKEKYNGQFPLLIKLLDAQDILSLQVHPDDNMAMLRHNCRGKSEMWYIINADSDAKIYCGFSEELTSESLAERIHDQSLMDAVQHYQSRAGQFYFIPAGTIHSIGRGNLIAEIQESSDITYRVYDHGRLDANGKPRQLHIDEARNAIDYTLPHVAEPIAKIFDGSTRRAVKSTHFEVDYVEIDGEATLPRDYDSFTAIMVTDGQLTIDADGTALTLSAGHTALVPACTGSISLTGCAKALSIHI